MPAITVRTVSRIASAGSSALMPSTRVGRPCSVQPATSPACVPPDEVAWTMTSGTTPCWTISPTARANPSAPSGVDAPSGISYGWRPWRRRSSAIRAIVGARSARDST